MKVQAEVKGKSVGLSPKTIDNKREPGLNLKFYCKPNTLKSPVPVGFTGSIVQNALLSALFGVQSCALIIPVQFSFAKYLEIRRTSKEHVQFHNFYHADEIGIDNDSAYFMGDLKQNHIMIADNKLLDEVYKL